MVRRWPAMFFRCWTTTVIMLWNWKFRAFVAATTTPESVPFPFRTKSSMRESQHETVCTRMKFLKNRRLVTGSALAGIALAVICTWYFRAPSREITRAELDQLVQANSITDGQVLPTPYAGIFHVEGKHKLSGKFERVFLTTHLDDAQIKALFDQRWVKIAIPDQGIRGQW